MRAFACLSAASNFSLSRYTFQISRSSFLTSSSNSDWSVYTQKVFRTESAVSPRTCSPGFLKRDHDELATACSSNNILLTRGNISSYASFSSNMHIPAIRSGYNNTKWNSVRAIDVGGSDKGASLREPLGEFVNVG